MRSFALIALLGCGRLGFDANQGGPTDATLDAPDGPRPAVDVAPLDAQLPGGLVAWFPLDDASQQSFADVVSGFGGACSGQMCPAQTAGVHGGARLFDGIDDCIEVANMGQFGQARMTVSLWLRQDASGNDSAVAKPVGRVNEHTNTWHVETSMNREVIFTTTHAGMNNRMLMTGVNGVALGTWHHVAGSFDGTTRRLYVDGRLVASDTTSTALVYGGESVWIGCDNNLGVPAQHFTGAVDDVQLYNRALSLAEIQALATM